MDAVSPTELYAIFNIIFNDLHATDYVKPFTVLNNSLRIPLEGVEYFSSETHHGECCSTQELANGKTRYHPKALPSVIVSPKQAQVIPLAPEFITPQEGHTKQDCELTASSRWLLREGSGVAANMDDCGSQWKENTSSDPAKICSR